jgi:hypothetical protein
MKYEFLWTQGEFMRTLVEFGVWVRTLAHSKGILWLAVACGAIGAIPAIAGTLTIDFENLPSLPTQPNNFAAAGAMQTYSSPGLFSISGGVVLGNPAGLAGFAGHGSKPNAYGTTDIADPSLLSTLVLTLTTADGVTNVSGVLFNGQPLIETYTVVAKSGASIVDSKTLSNIPVASSASDFANFSLNSTTALPITEVDFNAPADINTNGWDFLVDTVAISGAIPEPSTVLMMIGGVTLLVWRARRKA